MNIFRNRNFVLLWIGEGLSLTGAGATSVILPLIAVEHLGAGAVWMGVIGAATWLPWVVVGLPLGAWIDHRPPRRSMALANSIAALAYLSIPLAIWGGMATLGQLAIVAFIVGTSSVVFRSAYSKLIVRLFTKDERPRANSVLFGTENAANAVGPGLGGAIAGALTAVVGLLLEIVGLVVSVLCLLGMKVSDAAESTAREPLRKSVAEGLRLVFGDRHLRFFTIQGAFANFGLSGQGALLVLWFSRDLKLSPLTIGLVFALVSVGGILGALAAPAIGRRFGNARGIAATLSIAGIVTPLLAFAVPGLMLWVVVATNVFASAGIVAANVLRRTWVQGYVPEHMLARQSTSSQLLNFGLMPVAMVVAGALGAVLPLAGVIFGMGVVVLLANCASWLAPWLRVRDLPEPAHAPTNA